MTGLGVQLYGPVGPNGAAYTVQLDGQKPHTFTSNKELYKPQVLLYHADTLSSGKHSLTFTCEPSSSGQGCSIDFANVYTTSAQTSSHAGLSVGPVVGITLSAVGIVGAFIALSLFLRYRRQKQAIPPPPTYAGNTAIPASRQDLLPTPFREGPRVPIMKSNRTPTVSMDDFSIRRDNGLGPSTNVDAQAVSVVHEPPDYSWATATQ
ncbi:hypothetical protein H0H93_016459 [Arthromyces matolae]|nr:hypothetical protein H0H93_016459 [Arthromyces matolae]